MAVIRPQTDVYLLKCPLQISDINQLTFSNATAQYNYFNSLPKLTVNDFTYQRKDDTIRFPGHFDDLIGYNYVMYRNDAFSNKWFYAYVSGMEYLNDNVVGISIKTDVFQTWQFDLEYKRVFVEREHVNDDTVGLHTVPENLELGEYVVNGNIINSDLNPSGTESNATWICFQVSDLPDGDGLIEGLGTEVKGVLNGGVYSGLNYLLVLTPTNANKIIRCYDLASKSESIVAIFHVPFGVLNTDNIRLSNYNNPIAGNIGIATFIGDSTDAITVEQISLSKPTTINQYQPKNRKLLTYPYSYFYVTNNSGIDSVFHYEDFSGNPNFNIDGIITQGMSIKTYPTNYKNTTGISGYNYGISGGKLPICGWNSDYYTNWLTQNAVNIPISIGSGLASAGLGMIGSALSGNVLGMEGSALSGLTTIGNAVSRQYEASIVPDQAKGNLNCGDINVAEKRFGFTWYPISIKAEYARICDEYFDKFGYKVNRVKTPNVNGRRNWNFVKTVDCYIEADIPQEDLNEIKGMFDKGITFWHNTNTFMDYSQNNDII